MNHLVEVDELVLCSWGCSLMIDQSDMDHCSLMEVEMCDLE